MQIMDRYLLRLFLKILLVAFSSLSGLYFVVETFSNLDEFIALGKQHGSTVQVLGEYFTPRLLSFFDRVCGLLTLVAAIFAISWLRMNHEWTALAAAGIPPRRIIRSLIGAAVIVSVLGVVNRECVLPLLRDSLSKNAQDWVGSRPRTVQPRYDHQTDIFLHGKQAHIQEARIDQPRFRLHRPLGNYGAQLEADVAYYRRAAEGRPSGYLLQGVQRPKDLGRLPSVSLDDRPVILSPSDTPWLRPDQCFVVSDVDFEHLTGGGAWRQYASLPELIRGLRNPSLDYGADARVAVHTRLVQPFLDLTLFALGLPVVLARRSRGLFVSAGLGFLVIAGFFAVVIVCQAMGANGYLLTPSQAAWLPLIIFVPVARMTSHGLWGN